jgi:PPIC-type PPIASE domain
LKIVFNALVCLLLAAAGLCQTTTPSKELPVSPEASQAETPSPAPDTPVITIQGLCERPGGGSAMPADCKTVVTRADFEKVAPANMPGPQKKQVADRYIQALILAEKAHEAGADRTPDFEKQLYLMRLQLLARAGYQDLQKQSATVSDSDVEDYYKQHLADYKAISFDKLYVPKQKFVQTSAIKPNDPDADKKRQASEAEMKDEADKLRARAASGEDFKKLQQEAYDFAGLKQTAQSTRMENQRKNQVLAADSAIFELKAGDVSQVFNDPAGFMVYKVAEVKDLPVASVRDEISRTLQAEKLKSAMDALQTSVKTTLDESYFGAAAANAPTLRKPGETPAQNPAPAVSKTPPPPGHK